MDGRNISDEVEEEKETGSAGPSYTSQDKDSGNQLRGSWLGTSTPTDTDKRRDAVYAALNSASGQFVSTQELLDRAQKIYDFIEGKNS